MTHDLLVSGRIVTPDDIIDNGYVAISEGRIAAIGAGKKPAAERYFDGGEDFVLPGVIDGQTHAGSADGHAGLESLTYAAAAGGVTTIVDMPYDEPQPVTDGSILAAKIEAVNRLSHIDVALYGSFAKGEGWRHIAEQAAGGVIGFKIATYEAHPIRFPRLSPPEMLKGFIEIAKTGLPVAVHNEDMELVDALVAEHKAAGLTAAAYHSPSRPPLAEILANYQIMAIAEAAEVRGHIVHTSIPEACMQAQEFLQRGVPISVETCLHYLIFTDEDVARLGGRLKVNPPIRDAAAREALWACIEQGEIVFVSSDHAPWMPARKDNPDIFANAAGAPGVELLLPAFYTAARERGHDMHLVVEMLAEGPARHFGLYPQKGTLQVGADADITLFSPQSYIVDEQDLLGAQKWSSYHGMTMAGQVRAAFLRGAPIFDGESVTARPGLGRYVTPVGHD